MEEPEEEMVVVETMEVPRPESRSLWQKIGMVALGAVLFALPWLVSGGFPDVVTIPKLAFLAVGVLAGTAALFGAMLESRVITLFPSRILKGLGVFIFLGAVSSWYAVSPGESLMGTFFGSDSFVVYALAALAAWMVALFAEEKGKTFLRLVLWGTSIAGLISLFHAFGIHVIWASFAGTGFTPFGSPTAWGIAMGMLLSILAVLPWREYGRRDRIWGIVAGVIALASLGVLQYTLLWVSLALIMVMIAATRFASREPMGIPMLLAALAVAMAFVGSSVPRIGNVPIEVRPGVQASFAIAKDVWWSKRVLLGTGPGTYGIAYALHRPQEVNATDFWSFRFNQGYNVPLTLAVTMGLVGLLAYGFVLYAVGKRFARSGTDDPALPLLAGLLFILVAWLMHPASLTDLVFFIAGLGGLAAFEGKRLRVADDMHRSVAFVSFIVGVVMIALAVTGIYRTGTRLSAAHAYTTGALALQAGNPGDASNAFIRALAYTPDSDVVARAVSQALVARAGSEKDQGAVRDAVSGAVQAATQATQLNPADSLNWTNLGSIYEALAPIAQGAGDLAVSAYEKAMERDPQNPQEPVNAARALLGDPTKEHLDRAEGFLNKSLELKADYAPARFLLAQLYIRKGDLKSAVQKTEEIKAQNPFDAGVAFQLGLLYYQNQTYNQAISELERAVSLSPDYANARYFLGLSYDAQGRASDALDQFKAIAKTNPGNAEVDRIIANLSAGRKALQDVAPPESKPESRSDVPVKETTKKP